MSFGEKYTSQDQTSFFSQTTSIFENSCLGLLNWNIHHCIYKTFKVVNYFQLKSKTPVALCSNVLYKFSCSSDTNMTYIGMSFRHLIIKVREHLNFKSLQDSAIKDHILSCRKEPVAAWC